MKRYLGLVGFFITNLIGIYSTAIASPLLPPPPPPSLSTLSDVCENTKPFTLTNGTPVGGFYSGAGITGSTFNPSKAGVGTHTITYTVYTGGVPLSATTTIKVNGLPKPKISGTFADCGGRYGGTGQGKPDVPTCSISRGEPNISVCANSIGNYSTPTNSGSTYKWVIGGGAISSGQNTSNVTILWGTPGNGTMQVIETNASGCTDTAGLCITIKELPIANFSGTTSCLGIANQFTDLSTGATSWLWDFGDGTTSTDKNPSHIYKSCGNHTVKLTVKTNCGCPSTITKNISVNCSPGPKIICPSTVCAGAKASPYSTDATCSTYNWSVTGGTITGGQNTPNIIVDWGGGPVGTITLSTAGCMPATCTSPTTVNIPIIPTNPVISGDATPCQWDDVTYSLPAFPGGVYSWSIVPVTAGTINLGQGTNQVSVQWKNTPNAQLNVTVGNTFIGCSASASLPIKILSEFSSVIDYEVCKGSTYMMSVFPAGAFNWTLSGGGTIVSGQGTGTLTINWTTTGTHTITTTPVTPGLYCNSSIVNTTTVVETPPVDSISGQKYICPGSTYNYTAWPQSTAMIYKWAVVNGSVSPATGNPTSVTWGPSGPYSISVTQQPSSLMCASSPTTLTVNNINTTKPIITGLQTTCVNGTYTYTLPDLPGAGYTWSLSPSTAGSIVSGQGSNTVQILYNASGSATINAAISLCGSPVNVNLTVLVNPAPTPTVTITGNLCPGSTVTLTANPVSSAYEWKDGTMAVVGTSQAITTTVTSTIKKYILTVTNNNGCEGKTISSLVAAPEPIADISTPDKRNYCSTETINSKLYAQLGPGYTYQWYHNGNPLGTGNSHTATLIGTYNVIVTNAFGCTKTSASIVISQKNCSGPSPPCIPLSICGMPPCTPPPPGCMPIDSLAIDFWGNGSSWLKPKSTSTGGGKFSDIGASTMSVSENDRNRGIMPFATQIFCNNLINFTDKSPIPTIDWHWDFGDGVVSTLQNPSHTYAKAGFYYVEFWAKFTNSAYGKIAKSIEIPVVAAFGSKVSCGSAVFSNLSTHTPTSAITAWAWDFGDASTSTTQNPTHNYAAPGTYNVTLTVTAGGCTSVINKSVVVDPFPLAQFTFPSGCAGSPTPFTDASTAVGSSIIFWDWDFGDGTTSQLQSPTHTYTSNGTYTVKLKVTDINGCINTKTQSITITSPSGAGTISTSGATTFCSDKTVTLTAPPAAFYLWSNGSTLQSITVNQSGTYSVSTSSSVGCQATPPPVTVKVNPIPNNTTRSYTGPICGTANFYSSVVFIGVGKTYQWYNSGGAISGKTSSFFSTASPGAYYVIITDVSSGCTASSTPVTATFVPGLANGTVTGPSSLCPKTNITLTASVTGGTSPYTYSWASGETTTSINVTTPDYYHLTITDKNGCKTYPGKSIAENPLPDLSIFPVGCYTRCEADSLFGPTGYASYKWQKSGTTVATTKDMLATTSGSYKLIVTTSFGCIDTSGELSLTIAPKPVADAGSDITLCTGTSQLNGTGGLVYTWTPSTYLSSTTISNPISTPTSTIDYELLVADKNGCKDIDSVKITISCANPIVVVNDTSICPGACAKIKAIGSAGTPPYTYTWSTGETGSGIHSFCPSATTKYIVTVYDATGANATDTAEVIVHPDMSLISSSTTILCNGAANGSATVVANGGTPTFTYSWSPSGGTASTTPPMLPPNTYTVKVTDAKGCAQTSTTVITEPSPIVLSTSSTDANCGSNNGTAAVTITSGGTGLFTYLWMPGSATTASISNLVSGNYDVTVNDANGCTATTTAIVNSSSGPTLLAQSTNVSCFGANDGTAAVSPSGGSGLYTFNWQPSGGTVATATGLAAGIYTVSVDDGACVVSSTVEITEPPQINVSTTPTDAACGGTNGSVVVTVIGGVGTLTYTWTPSGGTGITENNLAAGAYTVVVADANGCTASTTAIVNNSGGLTASIQSQTNITCNGLSNGSATVTQTGGTAPYTYNWSSIGGTADNSSNLLAGTYSITVTDINGCINITTVTITEPAPIAINAAPPIAICIGQSSVLTASANGGTPLYTYNWMPGLLTGSSISASPVTSTTYTINVTDANGCTGLTQTVTVNVRPPLEVDATASQNNCLSDSTTLSASATGGNGNYTYTWMPINITGSTVKFKSPVGNTTYTVIVNDDCGTPSASDTVTITVSNLPTPVISSNTQTGCEFVCVQFTNTAASPSITKCYWTFGEGSTSTNCNPTSCYRTSGLYTISLTVTDNMGCTASATQKDYIKVYSSPTADFTVSPTSTTILDPVINFTDASSEDVVYWDWNFGDHYNSFSSNKNPSFTYKDTGTYEVRLVVTNAFGCVDTAIKYVLIEADYTFYVPNAFTPNDDGKNETFFPKGFMINPECYHMMIFDRWGNLIFETDDLNLGWDGKANGGKEIAQQDVYVWKIETCEYYKKRKHSYVGHVTLVK